MKVTHDPTEATQTNIMTAQIAQRLAYIKEVEDDLFDTLDNLHYLNVIGASEQAKDSAKIKIDRLQAIYLRFRL